MTPSEQSWALVVPVKRLTVAKSRLQVDAADRAGLALAMARDTVEACLAATAVAAVVVVTDDDRAAVVMRGIGAVVVGDEPDAGLNPALLHGAQVAAGRADVAVAALSSDLPALTPAVVDAVLRHADDVERGCVADAAGTGTTLLTARSLHAFVPQFGERSWRRHVEAGAADLTSYADARLRRDVDTLDDLSEALRLGCGPATVAAAAAVQGTALQ